MHDTPIRVLLVEDNPGDARLIQEMLAEGKVSRFDLVCADRFSDGMARLAERAIDVVLLDLSLPDSRGLETFVQMQDQVPDVPVLVLTGFDDEDLGVQAVREGAQDYLVKGQVDQHLLVRAVHYAIERKRVERELRKQTALDRVRLSVYEMRENADIGVCS